MAEGYENTITNELQTAILIRNATNKSVTITANASTSLSLSFLGLLPPTGYSIISVNIAITGANSTQYAITKILGMSGDLSDESLAIAVTNISTQNQTWNLRIVATYINDNYYTGYVV